ncbi:hypothetical protein BATDEDRAFT_25325 [Batrachochytrium dendrobatidis JAM81]|uniref:Uncharacterized protein n=1 Tax=Batrachochytrium dendrobatidis (strain JAM81 / FGSC 10211) TaxID=684364 RepID=F4P4Q3_BATDJ|nr:uncharacterized protein BATDEDRAFT_25325 [Batrachochytrium dendrobatidis JAM81]EGF79864.1 hypothetical protein BATDEDRAFT_25325 [Batrachochytrium dendrobatidis JAM81]|eukprot:XP_006679423.1 hypothetical protein BATDEDRAFT_25325 [Batrachochytrium dendrobatidis JAM81]
MTQSSTTENPTATLSINGTAYHLSQLEHDTVFKPYTSLAPYFLYQELFVSISLLIMLAKWGSLIGTATGFSIAVFRGWRIPGTIGISILGLTVGQFVGVGLGIKNYFRNINNLPPSPLSIALREVCSSRNKKEINDNTTLLFEFGPVTASWDSKKLPEKYKSECGRSSTNKYGDSTIHEDPK